jgi:hypothetical protein
MTPQFEIAPRFYTASTQSGLRHRLKRTCISGSENLCDRSISAFTGVLRRQL